MNGSAEGIRHACDDSAASSTASPVAGPASAGNGPLYHHLDPRRAKLMIMLRDPGGPVGTDVEQLSSVLGRRRPWPAPEESPGRSAQG